MYAFITTEIQFNVKIFSEPMPSLQIFDDATTTVNSSSTKMKIDNFSNSVDHNEVAHNEPPHLDLQCLPSCL